jgi:Predicted dithiol-disulfide isomerase involved in polyketide biosynthesis
MSSTKNKMKIEIWSDVVCPFCYIGKRKFEAALIDFEHAGEVEIIWKSYQLSPEMKTIPGKSIHQYLSEHKRISLDEATSMNNQVASWARQVGLQYDFDNAVPANTFLAHRFSHLAKKHGVQNEAEEKLFNAYFTEGKNIDDVETLARIGAELGIDATLVKSVLKSDEFADAVRNDIQEAYSLGLRGVPFFVFDRKFAVSGAQDSKVFLNTLEKAYESWKKEGHVFRIDI